MSGHAAGAQSKTRSTNETREVEIRAGKVTLKGDLTIPDNPTSVVLFAHGSGSSRHSPRNKLVASKIREAGLGTLLFDLLTPTEEYVDALTRQLRFDIGLLAERLVNATYWLEGELDQLRIGYFGASTGAAAALVAAAEVGTIAGAVVSRGGRPDLAGDSLPLVKAPTLLIVGSLDESVIQLNRRAYAELQCEKEISLVEGASHLFEEPGTLDQVARLAASWFQRYLTKVRKVVP
jgi:putative phosphoribosyl transferase